MNDPESKSAKKINFLSLTRNGEPNVGYPRNNGGYNNQVVRIQFNGDKLTSRYKILPVDYWQRKNQDYFKSAMLKGADLYHRQLSDDESEERLFSNDLFINNIINYIERIDILEFKAGNIELDILNLGKRLNVPIYIYNNINDFRKGKHINDTLVYDKNDEREINDKFKSKPYYRNLLINILGIIFTKNDLDYTELLENIENILNKYNLDIKDYNIEDIESLKSRVYSVSKSLSYGAANIIDIKYSLEADISNLVSTEHNENGYKAYQILVDVLKKHKCKNILQYIEFRLYNKLPNPTNINYAEKIKIVKIGFDDEESLLDINLQLDTAYKDQHQITPNRYSDKYYGDMLTKRVQYMYDNGKKFKDYINYIFNNYKSSEWENLLNLYNFGSYYRLKIIN
jgi:hypothetical protein